MLYQKYVSFFHLSLAWESPPVPEKVCMYVCIWTCIHVCTYLLFYFSKKRHKFFSFFVRSLCGPQLFQQVSLVVFETWPCQIFQLFCSMFGYKYKHNNLSLRLLLFAIFYTQKRRIIHYQLVIMLFHSFNMCCCTWMTSSWLLARFLVYWINIPQCVNLTWILLCVLSVFVCKMQLGKFILVLVGICIGHEWRRYENSLNTFKIMLFALWKWINIFVMKHWKNSGDQIVSKFS